MEGGEDSLSIIWADRSFNRLLGAGDAAESFLKIKSFN